MLYKAGLILEGGGMRGVFTSGVLDFFLDNDIDFEQVIGVSAGACHGAGYVAKQKGRAFRVNVSYLDNKHYCSVYSLLTTGDMFGADFVYHKIPKELDLFDFETFNNNPSKLFVSLTNVDTSDAEFKEITDADEQVDYIRASASLPYISRIVKLDGKRYLDGGVSASIPLKQSELNGYTKNVVILTQPANYHKDKNKIGWLARLVYPKYKAFGDKIINRHNIYNDELAYLENQTKHQKAFIIRPQNKLNIGRLEKNVDVLTKAYELGYQAAKENYEELMAYLNS